MAAVGTQCQSPVNFLSVASLFGAVISNTKQTIYLPVSGTPPPVSIAHDELLFTLRKTKLRRGVYVHEYKKTMNSKITTVAKTTTYATCAYCGGLHTTLTKDHMMPKWRGYSIGSNMSMVCKSCNTWKGGRTLGEWISTELAVAKHSDPVICNIYNNVNFLIRNTPSFIQDVYTDWDLFFY